MKQSRPVAEKGIAGEREWAGAVEQGLTDDFPDLSESSGSCRYGFAVSKWVKADLHFHKLLGLKAS